MADNILTTSDTATMDNTQSTLSQSLSAEINKDLDAVKKTFNDILSKRSQYDVCKDFGALEISGLDSNSHPPLDATSAQADAQPAAAAETQTATRGETNVAAPSDTSVLPKEASGSTLSFAPPGQTSTDIPHTGQPIAGGAAPAEVFAKPASAASTSSDTPNLATDSLSFLHPIDSLKELYHDLVDKKSEAPAKPSDTPAALSEAPEKTSLKQLESTKITDPKERAQFDKDMDDFEKRAAAHVPPLSQEEINKTYAQVARLLQSDKSIAGVSPDQRIKIAEQIMHTAANPSETDQGMHNTCGAAALESKLFTTNPSDAAKLIADVAITGEYKTNTNPVHTVKPDLATLTTANPDGHDYDYPPKSGVMSEVGRIFQTTVVSMEEPSYKQGTPTDPSKTGETIMVPDKDNFLHQHQEPFTGLTSDQLQDMDKKITGKDISDQLIQNKVYQPETPDGQTYCGSPAELGTQLAQLKEQGKLPAVIQVDCGNEPFFSDSKGVHAGGAAAGHFVTVTDYEPGPPAKVSVDNQWGKGDNHTGANAITLNELYRATVPPGSHEQITELQSEIADAKKAGQPTTELDLELARQRHIAKDPRDKISKAEYDKELKAIMVNAIHRWDKEDGGAGANEEERAQAWVKFINMLGDVPNDAGAQSMRNAVVKELKDSQTKHHHNLKNPALYYKEFKEQVDQ